MTKNGKMQQVMMQVLAAMLVASFLLASLSVVAQAWWYEECRYHHTDTVCFSNSPYPGYTWAHFAVFHTWKCHDGSGYCYDTGQVCHYIHVGDSGPYTYCP